MTFADALVEAARGRQRVRRPEIWRAFQATHPVEATAGDARERLMRRLRRLVDEGRVELPKETGSAWDRTMRPAIPEWVALTRPARPAPTVDVHDVPWAPELLFMTSTPGIEHLEDALAIHAFLGSGGRERPVVPMRERSVELFGEEKRLERLLRTPLFGRGRLDPQMLRCFAMAPPLVYEEGPGGSAGRPCLILENHHTWWSFCQWNRRVGAYSAVIYGAGGGFGRDAVAFVVERCVSWGTARAEYFGDLDFDGLVIPWRAATQFAAGSAVQILPATRWYDLLLERAEGARLPVGKPIQVESQVMDWLEPGQRSLVAAWFERGVRLPQELIGTEILAALGAEEAVDLPF